MAFIVVWLCSIVPIARNSEQGVMEIAKRNGWAKRAYTRKCMQMHLLNLTSDETMKLVTINRDLWDPRALRVPRLRYPG